MYTETDTNRGGYKPATLEWEVKGDTILTAHYPYLAECIWKGCVFDPRGNPMRFWAKSFEIPCLGITDLQSVLFDTSERIDEVVLRTRMTWYCSAIYCQLPVQILPYEPTKEILKYKGTVKIP